MIYLTTHQDIINFANDNPDAYPDDIANFFGIKPAQVKMALRKEGVAIASKRLCETAEKPGTSLPKKIMSAH